MAAEYVDMIVAVTGLVGAIGSILLLFAKTRAIGQSLKETDAWVLEHEDKLLEIAQASERLASRIAPAQVAEAQRLFSELVVKYKGDLVAAKADLEAIYGPLGDLLPERVR